MRRLGIVWVACAGGADGTAMDADDGEAWVEDPLGRRCPMDVPEVTSVDDDVGWWCVAPVDGVCPHQDAVWDWVTVGVDCDTYRSAREVCGPVPADLLPRVGGSACCFLLAFLEVSCPVD